MSEPTLADVLLRLDRLEAALYRLIDAVSTPRAQAPAAAAPIPVAPPAPRYAPPAGEPPIIRVAPPGATAPLSASAAAPFVASAPTSAAAEPVRPFDPFGDRPDIEIPPPSATVTDILTRVFEAALAANPEDTWAIMAKLTHPSQMQGPRAFDHFKAFNWLKLRRTGAGYLQNANPSTFSIVYTEPAEITPETDRARVFLKAGEHRMPVPVNFQRDPTQANAWRITTLSI